MTAFRPPDSQLVDTITAAEAVLGANREYLQTRLPVAGMLGRTNAERWQVFDA